MTDQEKRRSWLTPARAMCGLWVALYGAWYWIAPRLAERRGDSDEAGWLPMFLLPSFVFGGLIGLALVVNPKRPLFLLLGIATLVHGAVGLGLHGR